MPCKRKLRKLGVLLDMEEGLDKLMVLAEEKEINVNVENVGLTDVPLQSASSEDAKASMPVEPAKLNDISNSSGVGISGGPMKEAMSTLKNTSWDKVGPGNDDTTEVRTYTTVVLSARVICHMGNWTLLA